MFLFKRIKTLGSFLLQSGENSVCEVRVDGENLAIDDVIRVARENAKNSSVKPRSMVMYILRFWMVCKNAIWWLGNEHEQSNHRIKT